MDDFREYPDDFDEVIMSPTESPPEQDSGGRLGVSRNDFFAYMPLHRYIFAPTSQLWPARSVNARLGSIDGFDANVWLDKHRHVEQMTWAPGLPMLIEDRLISDGGWIVKPGCRTFNLYR